MSIPDLLTHWQTKLSVDTKHCGIKRMKTKWGSCNVTAQRIWLNLELAKKPLSCLEYVLVHELVHLLESSHNDRFTALMDEFLPAWRRLRKILNVGYLASEQWK
jgi:predicted metal-dependent hydrolase